MPTNIYASAQVTLDLPLSFYVRYYICYQFRYDLPKSLLQRFGSLMEIYILVLNLLFLRTPHLWMSAATVAPRVTIIP